MVRNKLLDNLAADPKDPSEVVSQEGTRLISHMWSMSYDDYLVEYTNTADREKVRVLLMQNIWGLLQQREYMLLQYYKSSVHLPNVLGTCGHFYAVEYFPKDKELSPVLSQTAMRLSTWTIAAVGLLDAIWSFETDFTDRLHMCDMQGSNFGISDKHTVKVLDLDMAIFDRKLKRELAARTCTEHSDCDYGDCRGWCDILHGKCFEGRINNNLQVKSHGKD